MRTPRVALPQRLTPLQTAAQRESVGNRLKCPGRPPPPNLRTEPRGGKPICDGPIASVSRHRRFAAVRSFCKGCGDKRHLRIAARQKFVRSGAPAVKRPALALSAQSATIGGVSGERGMEEWSKRAESNWARFDRALDAYERASAQRDRATAQRDKAVALGERVSWRRRVQEAHRNKFPSERHAPP